MRDKSIMTPNGFEIYCNSGNLFKNESDNPKAPSFKGLVNIDGKAYDLAIWENDRGFLNTKFSEHIMEEGGKYESYQHDSAEKTEEQYKKYGLKKKQGENEEFDDKIPF